MGSLEMAHLLYTTEYPRPLPAVSFRYLVDKLPVSMQEEVLRCRKWEDAYGHLFGKHLLRIALRRIHSPLDLGCLTYSAEKKPYLPSGPWFNISHSANRVVCFVSNGKEAGIDIEKITPVCPDDFREQFAPAEWSAIIESSDPIDTFYQFWTAKESIIKADGRGLGIPLRQVDVSGGEPVCVDGRKWALIKLPWFRGYACHVAVEAIGGVCNPGFDLIQYSPFQCIYQ